MLVCEIWVAGVTLTSWDGPRLEMFTGPRQVSNCQQPTRRRSDMISSCCLLFMAARHNHSWVLTDHNFPQHFPLVATIACGFEKRLETLEPRQREYLKQGDGQEVFCSLVEGRLGSLGAFQDCSQHKQKARQFSCYLEFGGGHLEDYAAGC